MLPRVRISASSPSASDRTTAGIGGRAEEPLVGVIVAVLAGGVAVSVQAGEGVAAGGAVQAERTKAIASSEGTGLFMLRLPSEFGGRLKVASLPRGGTPLQARGTNQSQFAWVHFFGTTRERPIRAAETTATARAKSSEPIGSSHSTRCSRNLTTMTNTMIPASLSFKS